MIEILPYMDIDDDLMEKASIKENDSHTFFMIAKDKDETLGIGTMKVYENYAVFCDVFVFDELFKMLGHGIGKAMLNFIERRNIYHVISENEKISDLLYLLKFKKESINFDNVDYKGQAFYLNLEGYFDAKCN